MSKYEQKAEIYGVIALATEKLIDEKNLERSGQGDVAEMYRNQSLDMMAELDEVYRKATAYDANYAMETSVIPTTAVIGLQDKLRKAEAFDRLRESYEYFSERKLKDVHGLGMDAYGIVGKYKTDSGEE